MAEILDKAAKGAEMTAKGTAATTRAILPMALIAGLIVAGLVALFAVGQMFDTDIPADESSTAYALFGGLGMVAVAIAWGAAAIAAAIHFAGRHLGRQSD